MQVRQVSLLVTVKIYFQIVAPGYSGDTIDVFYSSPSHTKGWTIDSPGLVVDYLLTLYIMYSMIQSLSCLQSSIVICMKFKDQL